MVGDLVDACFETDTTCFDEFSCKATDGDLLWDGWDDDTRVVLDQCSVQPAEVSVATQGRELLGTEVGAVSVRADRVDNVSSHWITDSLRIADFDGEVPVATV